MTETTQHFQLRLSPAEDEIKIEAHFTGAVLLCRITDVTGRAVMQELFYKKNFSWQVSTLLTGSYVFEGNDFAGSKFKTTFTKK